MFKDNRGVRSRPVPENDSKPSWTALRSTRIPVQEALWSGTEWKYDIFDNFKARILWLQSLKFKLFKSGFWFSANNFFMDQILIRAVWTSFIHFWYPKSLKSRISLLTTSGAKDQEFVYHHSWDVLFNRPICHQFTMFLWSVWEPRTWVT